MGMDNYNYSNDNGEAYQGGFRKIFLIAALSVLGVAVVAAIAILSTVVMKEKKYNSALAMGNAYYSSGDYENAIIQYQLAISIDGDKTAGYVNLASAYSAIGEYDSALYVLQRGLTITQDSIIEERVAKVETLANFTLQANEIEKLSDDEIKRISSNTLLENSIFDIISSYTYSEYLRDYGQPSDQTVDGKKVVLTYSNGGIKTTYYDLPDEKVLNNAGNAPMAAAKPCFVSLTRLDRMFDCKDVSFVIGFDRLKEFFGRELELKYDEGNKRYYVSAEYKGCRVSLQTDEQGRVISTGAWNEIVPLNRDAKKESSQSEGSISGYVQDALTGRSMRATIRVRNRGVRSGNAIFESETGTDGSYKFEGEAGNYTMEVSAVGYNPEYVDFEILYGQTKAGVNIVLAPITQGEIRIVLTWGAFPNDLDSHAEGRSSSGSNFHIFYGDSYANNIGELDVDDTSAYGPETITIIDTNANFSYYVVDFGNTGAMNASGATVKVYLPDGSMQTFVVNSSGSGNVWKVFDYRNGQIYITNTMS
jgi:uncharacterized protein YfaP (DUF2135 family)/tetratricopeptide (TPR) repeat protein